MKFPYIQIRQNLTSCTGYGDRLWLLADIVTLPLYALSMLHINDGMYGIKIRKLHPDDAPIMATIFFDAVHEGTKDHYTEAQRRAWGGSAPIPDRWRHTIGDMIGFIAEENGQPLGFMTIDAERFIDLAFVSPSVSGRGVGYQLYNAVEEKAHDLGAPVLRTEASKAAKPFFERQGWFVIEEQIVVKQGGVPLTNFKMQKTLE